MSLKLRISILSVTALSILAFSMSAIPGSLASSAASNSDRRSYRHSETGYAQSVLGAQPLIVIPVKFPDKSETKTIDYINKMVFSKMNEYFLEVSYGKTWFIGSVLRRWYVLPHQMSYYGSPGSGFLGDVSAYELVKDSINVADNDVDYRQYRYVIIVHSWGDEASSVPILGSDNIWSFAFGRSSPVSIRTNDGTVQLSGCVVSEFDPLGCFAHETGHMLGLPDLYNGGNRGMDEFIDPFVGGWDLMSIGSANGPLFFDVLDSVPAHISAWGKIRLGWIDQSQIKTVRPGESTSVEIEQLQARSSSIKAVIMPITRNQYFLIEVREKVGFDRCLPRILDRINVLVYYIDESVPSGRGPVRLQNIEFRPSITTSGGKVEAIQKDPYRLTITVLGVALHSFTVKVDYLGYALTIRTRMPNVPITIDDQQYLTDATGTLNARVSYAAHLVLASQVVSRGDNTRLVFDSWSDGVASLDRQISVQSDTAVDMNYRTQHRLNISSQYGTTAGGGWYDENTRAAFSVTSPVQDQARAGVRYSVVGHSGDVTGSGSSGTTMMDRPKMITFNWIRQYLLSYSSNPVGVFYFPSSSWHNEEESVTLAPGDLGGYRFLGWTLDGSPRLGSSITFRMNGSCNLVANYGRPSMFPQNVEIASTSALSRYSYDEKNRVVTFFVGGDYGTLGFSTVRIPKQLLWPERPTVKIDGQIPILSGVDDGGSVWIISLSYAHSDHIVTIPEFHQLGLVLVVTLFAVMILSRHIMRRNEIMDWSRLKLDVVSMCACEAVVCA